MAGGKYLDSRRLSCETQATMYNSRWEEKTVCTGSESPYDTLPINAETRDSSYEGPVELRSSSRKDISGCHNGDKRKCSTYRSKEKEKRRSVDLSYSVDHLVSVGKALAASCQLY
ncbi:hypothetical protein Fot_28653 [Forsythia ovata]|uniref:Uncharacterized protein n=1 Tax=Forsythia ovata TaxID=205694 RepID=A0ABD1TPQ3_9LAMI